MYRAYAFDNFLQFMHIGAPLRKFSLNSRWIFSLWIMFVSNTRALASALCSGSIHYQWNWKEKHMPGISIKVITILQCFKWIQMCTVQLFRILDLRIAIRIHISGTLSYNEWRDDIKVGKNNKHIVTNIFWGGSWDWGPSSREVRENDRFVTCKATFPFSYAHDFAMLFRGVQYVYQILVCLFDTCTSRFEQPLEILNEHCHQLYETRLYVARSPRPLPHLSLPLRLSMHNGCICRHVVNQHMLCKHFLTSSGHLIRIFHCLVIELCYCPRYVSNAGRAFLLSMP